MDADDVWTLSLVGIPDATPRRRIPIFGFGRPGMIYARWEVIRDSPPLCCDEDKLMLRITLMDILMISLHRYNPYSAFWT